MVPGSEPSGRQAGERRRPARVLVVCDDLLLRVKAGELAWRGGWRSEAAFDASALEAVLRAPRAPAEAAVVDLELRYLAALDAIVRLRRAWPRMPVVAFGAHTDVAGLEAARRAGAALAVPRSRFVREFPALIDALLAGSPE